MQDFFAPVISRFSAPDVFAAGRSGAECGKTASTLLLFHFFDQAGFEQVVLLL